MIQPSTAGPLVGREHEVRSESCGELPWSGTPGSLTLGSNVRMSVAFYPPKQFFFSLFTRESSNLMDWNAGVVLLELR